jgi:hypothetical protein
MRLPRKVVLAALLGCGGAALAAGCVGGPGAFDEGDASAGGEAGARDAADSAAATCTLPPDPGPCEAAFESFFFNAETGRCETFTYGGCDGNANRFDSADRCVAECAPDHEAPCTIVRCPHGEDCVYRGEAPTCALPCVDQGACPGDLACECGSSCPSCRDCIEVCVEP